MEWSDTALVLGVGRFRESDLWLRMLTRRHGIVSAFAFGGRPLLEKPEPQTILWLSGSFQRTPDQYQNDPKRHVPFLAGG